MKKTLLIISLTILTITAVKSQEKIQFGAKGGINFTTMTSDFLIDKEYKTGFHIGILAEFPFGDIFSLQPEILYSTHRVKGKEILDGVYPGSPAAQPNYAEYKLNYIQVPVLAKIYLVKNFSLELGPSFNFLTYDRKIRLTDLPDIIIGNEVIPQEKYFDANGNSFEFSGIIGISYKFKGGFFGSLRYIQGMSDAIDSGVKNNSFQIGIGYFF